MITLAIGPTPGFGPFEATVAVAVVVGLVLVGLGLWSRKPTADGTPERVPLMTALDCWGFRWVEQAPDAFDLLGADGTPSADSRYRGWTLRKLRVDRGPLHEVTARDPEPDWPVEDQDDEPTAHVADDPSELTAVASTSGRLPRHLLPDAPDCPTCGTPGVHGLIDVTSERDHEPRFITGMSVCPNAAHHRFAAFANLEGRAL